jgi:HK97 family phage prohead protease
MKSRILMTKEAPTAKGMVIECAINFASANETELKALGDDVPEGYVAGWASTRDLDSYGHVVEVGAFTEAITKRGLSGPKGIKFLKGHDRDWPIGVIKVLEYRGDRLWIEAQFELSISYARDLWLAVKMNGGMSFSVGFFLENYDWKVTKDPEVEYLYITKGDLFEVSVVPFAGNEEAVMTYVKDAVKDAEAGGAIQTPVQFEKALVAAGLCKNRSDAHRAVLFMKQHIGVFAKEDASLEEPPSDDPPVPVLDPEKLDLAFKHLQTIKALLTT